MSKTVRIAEAQAHTKTCPFTMGKTHPGPYNCVGSDCMAWRWSGTCITNPANPTGDLIFSENTHGFCGISGVPK